MPEVAAQQNPDSSRPKPWQDGQSPWGLHCAALNFDREGPVSHYLNRSLIGESDMIVGVPTEVKSDEYRIGMRPVGVEMLITLTVMSVNPALWKR